MYKTPSYDIHASFLVPAYNLPAGVLSHYITTEHGQHDRGSIAIDVWLVSATKDNPTQSMIASLRREKVNYQVALEQELSQENPTNDKEQSLKTQKLENGKELFSRLIAQAQDPVYHKKPDDNFLKIAKTNFARSGFSSCQPDLQNYLYLASLSRFEER